MKVKQLAKRSGVSSDTVRYYTQLGILNPVKDEHNGYRHYSDQDTKRLDICLKAKCLGFTLSDIRHLLDLMEQGTLPYQELQHMLKIRLENLKKELDEQQALYQRMQIAWDHWSDKGDGEPKHESNSCAFDFWSRVLSIPGIGQLKEV